VLFVFLLEDLIKEIKKKIERRKGPKELVKEVRWIEKKESADLQTCAGSISFSSRSHLQRVLLTQLSPE